MSSFLNKFKSSGNVNLVGSPTSKKDTPVSHATPIERLLADSGPARADGSDKFFGLENFGNTCYFNSILQCLYHNPAFRQNVLDFPVRHVLPTNHDTNKSLDPEDPANVRLPPTPGWTGLFPDISPPKIKTTNTSAVTPSTSKATSVPHQYLPPGKDENKDTPEYKKKLALSNGPVLNFDVETEFRYGMQEGIFTAIKDIFESLSSHESKTGVVSPKRAVDIMRRVNPEFNREHMHQDAHECLNFSLNEIAEDVEKYAKNLSRHASDAESTRSGTSTSTPPAPTPDTRWVHDIFEGKLTSETRCLTCQNVSSREETFLDLSVDLEQFSSVTSCLDKFSEEEMLSERNKFHCDRCFGLQEAEKRMKLKKLPRVLGLHLKRFAHSYHAEGGSRMTKLNHRVSYPYYLRLFNLTDDSEDPDKLYELCAVIVHIGSTPYQGHYVSIIKTPEFGWLLFDDENIEPVEKNFVRNFFGGENSLASAYILFYQETTYEAAERGMDEEDRIANSEQFAINIKDFQTNGKATANGFPGSPKSPSPLKEGQEWSGLDRFATAPLVTPIITNGESLPSANLEHAVTSPSVPFLGLSKKKSVALKRVKGLEREEKEKKLAAEKEEKEKKAAAEREEKDRRLAEKAEKEREERERKAAEKAAQKEALKTGAKEKKPSFSSYLQPSKLHKFQSKRDLQAEKHSYEQDATQPVPTIPAARNSLSTASRNSHNLDHMDVAEAPEPPQTPSESSRGQTESSNGKLAHALRLRSGSISGSKKRRLWGTSMGKIDLSTLESEPTAATNDQPAPELPPRGAPRSSAPPAVSDHPDPATLPPLPPTPVTQSLAHFKSLPANLNAQAEPSSLNAALPPLPARPEMDRTPTPTALPQIESPDKKKKSKKRFFGFGRNRSVSGV